MRGELAGLSRDDLGLFRCITLNIANPRGFDKTSGMSFFFLNLLVAPRVLGLAFTCSWTGIASWSLVSSAVFWLIVTCVPSVRRDDALEAFVFLITGLWCVSVRAVVGSSDVP